MTTLTMTTTIEAITAEHEALCRAEGLTPRDVGRVRYACVIDGHEHYVGSLSGARGYARWATRTPLHDGAHVQVVIVAPSPYVDGLASTYDLDGRPLDGVGI